MDIFFASYGILTYKILSKKAINKRRTFVFKRFFIKNKNLFLIKLLTLNKLLPKNNYLNKSLKIKKMYPTPTIFYKLNNSPNHWNKMLVPDLVQLAASSL